MTRPTLLPAVGLFLASSLPALAADAPAAHDYAPAGRLWVTFVVAFALVLFAVVVNMMSSKRGHRD